MTFLFPLCFEFGSSDFACEILCLFAKVATYFACGFVEPVKALANHARFYGSILWRKGHVFTGYSRYICTIRTCSIKFFQQRTTMTINVFNHSEHAAACEMHVASRCLAHTFIQSPGHHSELLINQLFSWQSYQLDRFSNRTTFGQVIGCLYYWIQHISSSHSTVCHNHLCCIQWLSCHNWHAGKFNTWNRRWCIFYCHALRNIGRIKIWCKICWTSRGSSWCSSWCSTRRCGLS